MMRSMFAGISGLRSHQTMMDVVGNNISNVNTAGFKSSVVTFQEALSQTIQGPTAAGADTGGALACQPDLLTLPDPLGDLHGQRFRAQPQPERTPVGRTPSRSDSA